MFVCLNARGALGTAQSPREGTEQALGERKAPLPAPQLSTPRELQLQSLSLA